MTTVEPIDLLRKNLELAKEQLKIVDCDIKRITGRDPSDDRFRRTVDTNIRRSNVNLLSKPQLIRSLPPDPGSSEKQKVPEDDLQVSIASSVVRVGESRTRLDATKSLKTSDKERGRRMLGILQGTLNQFRAESAAAVAKPQMAKRREVDAKLEARAEEEKEVLRRERAELFRARREQQLEVNLLQEKMRMAKGFELWKTEMEKMIGFCRTEVRPHIFFKPKKQNDESKRCMENTARAIHDMINRRKRKLDLNFEETSMARRRHAGPKDGKEKLNDSRDSEFDDNHSNWSPTRTGPTLNSTVSTVPARSQFDSNSNSKINRRRPRASSLGNWESGEMSDASETFAIEGDEEPLLMEEEHVTANASTASLPHSPLPVQLDQSASSPKGSPDSPHENGEEDDQTAEHSSPSTRTDTRTVHLD